MFGGFFLNNHLFFLLGANCLNIKPFFSRRKVSMALLISTALLTVPYFYI